VEGVQITSGDAFNATIVNSADNALGQIDFAAGKLGAPFPTGSFELASIQFEALAPTDPTTSVVFNTSGLRTTLASDPLGNVITGTLTGGIYTVAGPSDTTPPTVTNTSPANGAIDVPVSTAIVITFSEPMNQAAAQGAFSIRPSIPGSFGWNAAGTIMTYVPSGVLANSTTYDVGISTAATDLAGNALTGAYQFSFTTAAPGLVPPSVSTQAVSGLTSTSAVLHGNLTDLGTASSVALSFEWEGVSGEYSGFLPGVPAFLTSPGTFTAEMTGLAPNTTWRYRAVAVGDGTSYGEEVFFTTLQEVPVPQLAVVTREAVYGFNSAILFGELASLGEFSSAQVYFEWGETTEYGNTTTLEESTVAQAFAHNIHGLTPLTTYHYRAVAQADGITVRGEDNTFTPFAVNTLDATNIYDTSATLNGYLVELDYMEYIPVSFEWGTDTSYGQTTEPVLSGGGTYSTDIQELAPGTTYHFRAMVVLNEEYYYGLDKQFTTLAPGCQPPEVNPHNPINITDKTATLKGELLSLGSVSTVQVRFVWGTEKCGPYIHVTKPVDMTSPGTFEFTLKGLAPGTEYFYKAKAEGDGISYGTEHCFTTLPQQENPPVVTTDKATSITADSAKLNGQLTDLGSAEKVYVSFEYGEVTSEVIGEEFALLCQFTTEPVEMTSTGAFSATVTGLTLGKTYWFQAKAMGDGDACGDKKTFTTAKPSSGGGGGGGSSSGGGGKSSSSASKQQTVKLNGFTTAGLITDASGKVLSSVQLKTEDGKMILDVAQGTVLQGNSGAALDTISASPASSPLEPPAESVTITQYSFGPEAARFSPYLTLTFTYDPASLPEGVAEEALSLAYWNGSQWVNLPAQVDGEARTVSAKITHFSEYALLAGLPSLADSGLSTPLNSPAEAGTDTAGAIQSTVSDTGNATPADAPELAPAADSGKAPDSKSAPLFLWVLVGIVGAVVIATVAILVVRRRAEYNS
jgi:hypothetical protein